MAKQRIVNTKFWDDSYISGLSAKEKLLFLYLITNPLTNISGVYELPVKRVAFDTGLEQGEVELTFKRFAEDGKLIVSNGWVAVVNFIKHQALNPKIKLGIAQEIKKAPKEVVDRLSIDYGRLSIGFDSLSHLNPNSNINSNSNLNGLPLEESSTGQKETLRRKRKEVVEKWRI